MKVQRVLSQRYELKELIGTGGMADVYLAEDKLLSRSVAVKILHEEYRRDVEFIGKFHKEAQSAARLSHPNIINIYDVGIDGDDHYIVMELVKGSTLKTKIKESGKLPVNQALSIAKDIAEALSVAHKEGIVHCDIKSHNILLSDTRAKVADFGIARAVTESTMTYSGNIVGSVHYFSPEQAKGSYITPKSDVYSLGVVLYEMLTGKLPFNGDNPVSIAMKHLEEPVPPMRNFTEDIPPVVESIVAKAMEKDPALRPSAAEFAKEIEDAQRLLDSGKYQADPEATQILKVSSVKESAVKEEPPKKHSASKKVFGTLLALILALGFCVGAFLSFGKFWSAEEVTVPDVTGKQMTLARQVLEDAHLRVNIAETYDANVPPGQVVSQSPEVGARVKSERLVTIYVSKGGEVSEMPDLLGLSREHAENRIRKMGLSIGTVYEKIAKEEAGTVIATEPKAGAKISKGGTVDLTISKAEQKKTVTVPDVTGTILEAAESTITSRKLKVGSIIKKESAQEEGTIISQSPAAGSEAEEDSTINLVIAIPEESKQPENTEGENNQDGASTSNTTEEKETPQVPSRSGDASKQE